VSATLLGTVLPLGEVAAWAAGLLALSVVALGALFLLARKRERRPSKTKTTTREAQERASEGGRELDALARLSTALSRSGGAAEAAEHLFNEVETLAGVDATLLALVDEDGKRATGFAARGVDAAWWGGVAVDLEHEAGGIATVSRERTAYAVYDVEATPNINRRLASAVGAKSAAFVPLISEGRVTGVLVVASVGERRFFGPADLELMQQLANEAALAVERTRSATALEAALERERLVSEIARKVRSELDLDNILQVAVSETARALGVARCFIRLGGPGEPMPVNAEWRAPGVEPIGTSASRLPVSNLAVRERRTIAVADVQSAPELDDPTLGGRETLLTLGSRAVVATPIVIFDQVIGVFAAHRAKPGPWSATDVALAESVAGEAGLAIHTARLLQEDARRLGRQSALLKAAQVVTSDLRFDSVLRRLVEEVTALLEADAADCWMFEPGQNVLRCRAVAGLPESEELGRELPPHGTHAEAIETGRPVLRTDFARSEDPPPSENFAAFEEVMVAPMTWLGEVRGVLGVCSREAGRFDSSELELLEGFARFASLASHNAESFEERERQARIQRGFYRIAEVLGSPLSLAETFDALAQAAAEALGADAAVVLEPNGDGLTLAGSYELPRALATRLEEGLPRSATPFLAAAREERIVSSAGLQDDDRFDEATRALLREHDYRSLLSAPVPASGGANDAVVVLFRAERTFSDDDLTLARHLSRAARGALERSELFETERRARSLSQRLASVGARLAMNLDPSLVLEEVVREAPELLEGDAATIRLLEGEELVVRAAYGAGSAGLLGTRSASGAGLLGELVQSRSPARVEDAHSIPQLARDDPLLARGMSACLAVPMVAHGGGLHGVLTVYAATPRAWGDDELQALVALAAVASAALSKAELYQRVADEKERSDAILSNIADGIVAVDRDERIVLWNSMAEQITGVPEAEAVGRRVSEALQRELASEGNQAPGERHISILRGGKEVWLSLTEAVMRDAAGTVAGRIFAFRDVSGERIVDQMKSDFVATVSHELRTPLTSIYGFAETLLRSDVAFGEEERTTFLGYIASESERLIRIVDDLLNVARLEAGTLGLAVAPTNVSHVVEETVGRFAASVDGDHRFVVDVPDGSLYADADAEKLGEVVGHLVDNAVKFSPQGGTVTVSGRRKSDTVEVRVADEGIGISRGDQQRIFTKFYRADSTPETAAHGTGLGLFLARGLVAAMRGRIWVESEEGKGSSFVFELPVSNVAPESAEPVGGARSR
jgi:PAS domain S-box-containing protein